MNRREHYMSAWRGRTEWKKLKRKYQIGDTDVILFFPGRDEELNYYACLHLRDILERKRSRRAFLVSSQDTIPGEKGALPAGGFVKIKMGQTEIELIMKYYQLVKFSDFVFIITLTWPESNYVSRMLGKHGVNKEDIVCLGLYTLRNVPKGNAEP